MGDPDFAKLAQRLDDEARASSLEQLSSGKRISVLVLVAAALRAQYVAGMRRSALVAVACEHHGVDALSEDARALVARTRPLTSTR